MSTTAISAEDAFEIAVRATFETFANCYLREIDRGRDFSQADKNGIEWQLTGEGGALRAEIEVRSRCGPHRFGMLWHRWADATRPRWTATEPLDAVARLLREAYCRVGNGSPAARAREVELYLRVLLSCQAIAANVAGTAGRPARMDFIAAEQSIVFGHSFHPTPKSMQGVTEWQRGVYGPESGGAFQLVGFAARAEIVEERTAGRCPATRCMERIARPDLAPGERLILMHPLQAQALMLDGEVEALMTDGALRPLGAIGPEFKATSSMRTVYCEDAPFMLKFSLPVRITNSIRRSRRNELYAGVAIARYFRRTRVLDGFPAFSILLDTAFATVTLPGRAESGFETILRQNPFRGPRAAGAITVAALTGEPLPGEASLLARLVALSPGDARSWFAAYLDVAFVPLVLLYDATGIALEAHQQNALVKLEGGRPTASFYRDNQGYYLADTYRHRLLEVIPEADEIDDLFFDEAEINDRFAYYLVVNHIFAVIARLGRDGLADEGALIALLRARIERLAIETEAAGRRFCRRLLDEPTITMKGNLAARLFDIDELGGGDGWPLYARGPNVLFDAPLGGTQADRHALTL
ncbi:IucA/IucC family protein [Acuticoccus sediminis]|uniref:IucA/IucC family protein n=1 Tax=Acuticoccus sediminis TaxID=2184697 RepID=UPI001CFD0FA2|nr:IucA/IucC family protein [Acuticoccus sediminis]